MTRKHLYMKLFLISAVIIVIVWFVCRFKLLHGFNLIESIREAEAFINSCGEFAALIYILIFSLRTLLVVFPCSVLVILGGSIFGPFFGFLYSMTAIFVSASLAFFISRYLGMDFVHKILRNKFNRIADIDIEQHGLKIIFLMRISMLFPYDITNFAAGLTKVRYRDFIIGTVLGTMPETFALNYLGDNLAHPDLWKFGVSIALILVTIAVPLLYKRSKVK